MATVMQRLLRVLPAGTQIADPEAAAPLRLDWSAPPTWPPDLFAVAATLVNISGCYAHSYVTRGRDAGFTTRVRTLGKAWREGEVAGALEERLRELWCRILAAGDEQVTRIVPDDLPMWAQAAVELMAIADEASAGIGFGSADNVFNAEFLRRHFSWISTPFERAPPDDERRRNVATLCILVPPEECCVQPKGRTPQVGCTLRSLSHHLALLPPMGEVTTRYLVQPDIQQRAELNLLLVPYPFRFGPDALTFGEVVDDEKWGYFETTQSWLPFPGNADAQARRIADFLIELMEEGEEKSGHRIHGIVLPELSLSREAGLAITRILAATTTLDFFVGGVLFSKDHLAENRVLTAIFKDREVLLQWEQHKHHRWRLTDSQIRMYGITPPPAGNLWWERIDVVNREVVFGPLSAGALFASLVCEDLARQEPVHSIVRAVGPSLLFALLLDGAQFVDRWAAQASSTLAEDPGIAVLTLTSAAPVRATNQHFGKPADEPLAIATWREPGEKPLSITIPKSAHGVVLPLKLEQVEERTMDRRTDGSAAVTVRRAGNPVPVSHPSPPAWS